MISRALASLTSTHEVLGLLPTETSQLVAEGCFHGKSTDVQNDLPLLWTITRLLEPTSIIELGVRHGITSRTLAHAAMQYGGTVYGYDPDPRCAFYLQELFKNGDYDYHFEAITGEQAWEKLHPQIIGSGGVDMLMIDTDPHTREQTRGWLETWVLQGLAPGGVAVFHDIVPAREEIQVEAAILDFLCSSHIKATEWVYRRFPTPGPYQYQYGLGLLWRLQ